MYTLNRPKSWRGLKNRDRKKSFWILSQIKEYLVKLLIKMILKGLILRNYLKKDVKIWFMFGNDILILGLKELILFK